MMVLFGDSLNALMPDIPSNSFKMIGFFMYVGWRENTDDQHPPHDIHVIERSICAVGPIIPCNLPSCRHRPLRWLLEDEGTGIHSGPNAYTVWPRDEDYELARWHRTDSRRFWWPWCHAQHCQGYAESRAA